MVGNAFGTQGYTCLPTSTGGTSWTVNPARPEATLFADFFGQTLQIIAHFLSPDANPNQFAPNPLPPGGNATWQSSFDTSKVWATERSMLMLLPKGRGKGNKKEQWEGKSVGAPVPN